MLRGVEDPLLGEVACDLAMPIFEDGQAFLDKSHV